MRIEMLRMQAFGPYVKLQELDFSALAKHHLFLLRGMTGAGKTAILDAITYALYGKSSGGDRGDFEKMRSRMAKPEDKTFVELHIALQGHRYRFIREIIIGHKRNGTELTKIKVNGGEVVDDVFYPFFENCKQSMLEQKAVELIGLNHAQFIQVMLLPQGKFEKLLISKSEEKQEILKTLFQTERWSKICDTLSEQLRLRKEELDQQQRKIDVLLASSEVKTLAELDEQRKDREEQLAKLLAECAQSKQEMEHVSHLYEEQAQIQQLSARLQELRAQQSTLNRQKEQMKQLQQQLSIYEEQYRLQPYVNAYAAAQRKQKEGLERLKAKEQELQDIKGQLHSFHAMKDQIVAQRQALEGLRQQKNDWAEQFALWDEKILLDQQKNNIKEQCDKAQKHVQTVLEQLDHLELEENEAIKKQEHLESESAQLPDLMEKLQILNAQKQVFDQSEEIAVKIASVERELRVKEAEYKKTLKQEEAAQQMHEQLYQTYLKHSAALLTQLLKEGQPCPVCGSLHHPHIANAQQQNVELKQLKEKKALWEACIKARQKLEVWIAQTNQRLQEYVLEQNQLKMELSSFHMGEWKEKALTECKAQINKAQKATKALVECKKAINLHKERRAKLEEEAKAIQQKHQQLTQQWLIMETKQNERFAKLPKDLSYQAFKKQYELLLDQIKKSENHIHSFEEEVKQTEVRYAATQAAITQLQEEQRNQSQSSAEAKEKLLQENKHKLDLSEHTVSLSELEQEKLKLAHYETEIQQNAAAISEVSVQLQGRECFPIETLKQQKMACEQHYQKKLQDRLALEQQMKRIEQIYSAVSTLRKSYEQVLLDYTKQNEFVKAMRGDTSIGIERYVLGILLSSITQNANQLLKNVHGGRYQIYRSDEASGRTRKFGLELSVYDSYSCSMRSVVSLSGGEKFLVSLALSLALSTVVQARSGGVVIETMFIDEGFGSLDEQSIADALQILSTMANAKAMIGIISHVELLKENIPYGIEVSKHPNGSTCRLLV